MGLFDSPSHILILLVVALLVFGAKRLPGSARSLGQALRIFKAETSGLRGEEQAEPPPAPAAPQQIAPAQGAPMQGAPMQGAPVQGAPAAEAQRAEAQQTSQRS